MSHTDYYCLRDYTVYVVSTTELELTKGLTFLLYEGKMVWVGKQGQDIFSTEAAALEAAYANRETAVRNMLAILGEKGVAEAQSLCLRPIKIDSSMRIFVGTGI